MLEIRAVLAMLCRNFDLEPVNPGREVKEKMAVVMRPDHIPLRLRRRSSHGGIPVDALTHGGVSVGHQP